MYAPDTLRGALALLPWRRVGSHVAVALVVILLHHVAGCGVDPIAINACAKACPHGVAVVTRDECRCVAPAVDAGPDGGD